MSLDVIKENQVNGAPVNLAGDGKYDSPGKDIHNPVPMTNYDFRIFCCLLYIYCAGPKYAGYHWLVCCS